MVGIERNKDPELTPKERNTSYFVILDDRKHGRSGKFPVFYDVDTGDYLEPPEGFLESEYQTLREWYNTHPKDDPTLQAASVHKRPNFDPSIPLSRENEEGLVQEGYELTQDQIPEAEEVESIEGEEDDAQNGPEEAPVVIKKETPAVDTPEAVVSIETDTETSTAHDDNDWDDDPPF